MNSKYEKQYSTTIIETHTATDFSHVYRILKLPNITIKVIGITNKELLRIADLEYPFQIFLYIVIKQPITTKKGRTEISHYRQLFAHNTTIFTCYKGSLGYLVHNVNHFLSTFLFRGSG
jgi:hypothetical protein